MKEYDLYLKKWIIHCTKFDIDYVGEVLDYLHICFREGYSYSTLNTIGSALSQMIRVINKPVGQHYLLVMFLRSVFQ